MRLPLRLKILLCTVLCVFASHLATASTPQVIDRGTIVSRSGVKLLSIFEGMAPSKGILTEMLSIHVPVPQKAKACQVIARANPPSKWAQFVGSFSAWLSTPTVKASCGTCGAHYIKVELGPQYCGVCQLSTCNQGQLSTVLAVIASITTAGQPLVLTIMVVTIHSA
jgi:hypothetical protein